MVTPTKAISEISPDNIQTLIEENKDFEHQDYLGTFSEQLRDKTNSVLVNLSEVINIPIKVIQYIILGVCGILIFFIAMGCVSKESKYFIFLMLCIMIIFSSVALLTYMFQENLQIN